MRYTSFIEFQYKKPLKEYKTANFYGEFKTYNYTLSISSSWSREVAP